MLFFFFFVQETSLLVFSAQFFVLVGCVRLFGVDTNVDIDVGIDVDFL